MRRFALHRRDRAHRLTAGALLILYSEIHLLASFALANKFCACMRVIVKISSRAVIYAPSIVGNHG